MRIFITGATGFIGREITNQLMGSGHQLLVSGRSRFENFDPASISYLSADICNESGMKSLIEDFKPDIIIHTAAMAAPDECEKNKDECFKINVGATGSLFDLSVKHRSYFLLLSTDFVFEGDNGPYEENDRRNAVNYYGVTKIQAENILMSSSDNWGIARTVLTYGRQIPGFRPSFQTMIINNLKSGNQLKLANDQYRTPTYLPDLAGGLIKMAENKIRGIFHMSGNDLITVYDMGIMIAEIAGLDKELIIPVPTSSLHHPAQRPLRTGLICKKAEAAFGYSPVPLRDGLKNLINAQPSGNQM